MAAAIYREAVPLVLAAGSMLDHSALLMIDAAADAGFDGIGVRLSSPTTAAHGIVDVAATRRHAASRGVSIHDAEVHRIGSDGDPTRFVERAAAIGAGAVLVVSDTDRRTETLDGIGQIVDVAAPYGLRVVVEYMAWTDPSTPADAVSVARATGSEVLVDLLHHVRVGAGVRELEAVVASGTLAWVQLCDAPLLAPADADLIHEARHGRLPPGAGELPLGELLACIPDDVVISVEVQSTVLGEMPPAARAKLLHDTTRDVIDRCRRG